MRKDLFYSDTDDVVVDVHVPRGLKTRRPTLAYLFGRADAGGKCELVSASSVSSFAESGDSLVYRLILGRHSHGVYALALSLQKSDGAVIEERTREPLVVLRKMELKRVDGKEYTQGLDLELEDVVDFTDPRDPHPWIESKRPAKLYGQTAAKVETPVIVRGSVWIRPPKESTTCSDGRNERHQPPDAGRSR